MRSINGTNILAQNGGKTSAVFSELYPDILSRAYDTPAEFIATAWSQYTPVNPALNGNVFEALIACLMYREGIRPLYIEAKIAFIPNVLFDQVVYTEETGPIVMSIKTSLRERYKQADLEGMFLRNVHRKARSFLITMNKGEARNVNQKIKLGQVLGLDEVIFAGGGDLNNMVKEIQRNTLIKPGKVDVMTALRVVD